MRSGARNDRGDRNLGAGATPLTPTLERLNAAPPPSSSRCSKDVRARAVGGRARRGKAPVFELPQLKRALVEVVREAGREGQLALPARHTRSSPASPWRPVRSRRRRPSSRPEPDSRIAGPDQWRHCGDSTPRTVRSSAFRSFSALRGPRGLGLSTREVIATFERRLAGHPEVEFAECCAMSIARGTATRRVLRVAAGTRQSCLGLGRGARRHTATRVRRERPAHRSPT